MKMEAGRGRLEGSGRGCEAGFGFGAPSPQTNLAPGLGSTPRRTRPCRPPTPGEHQEETAPRLEVAPPVRTGTITGGTAMDILHERCAGLDVHQKTVVACVRCPGPDGAVTAHVPPFGTMTADLLALADWLAAYGVRHVALESTGVYWKPIFPILEGRFEVLLVNAGRLKQVPGRKTDVKDAEGIAQLLQHGLLASSFIPEPEVRELTRQRAQLVRDQAAVANRIPKVLEDANIKLGSVASDVLGVSGRAMIRAILEGCEDPARRADLAEGRLRGKMPQLKRALVDQHEALEGLVARYEERIAKAMKPFPEAAAGCGASPGWGRGRRR